jgi:hypothetical protein
MLMHHPLLVGRLVHGRMCRPRMPHFTHVVCLITLADKRTMHRLLLFLHLLFKLLLMLGDRHENISRENPIVIQTFRNIEVFLLTLEFLF